MSAKVKVTGDKNPYVITISECGSTTWHEVTLDDTDRKRIEEAGVSASVYIEAAFKFLLDREPKESILRSFDFSVISDYFPEFKSAIQDYL